MYSFFPDRGGHVLESEVQGSFAFNGRGEHMFWYESNNKGPTQAFEITPRMIEDFVRCPRCFVLEVKHGVKRPPLADSLSSAATQPGGDGEKVEALVEQIKLSLDNPEVPVSSAECELCRFARNRNLVLATLEEIDELPPRCPDCEQVMSRAVYGMQFGPMPTGFVSMGCIVERDAPQWVCTHCEVDEDY
jgi:hypothetical protein